MVTCVVAWARNKYPNVAFERFLLSSPPPREQHVTAMQSVRQDRGKEKPEPGLELRRAESCGLPSGLGDAVREHEPRVPEGPERYSAIGSDHQVGDTAIVEGAMEPAFGRKLQRCALSPATNDTGVTSEALLIIFPLLGMPRGMQFRSAASIRTPSSQHAQWPLPVIPCQAGLTRGLPAPGLCGLCRRLAGACC
ncbi:uncharacterized protein LOC111542715 [Piliocolobus tephrosceles]|uniref:uncharacterized protein LOC111542715 n=1 Tax=Piliocolobus tephrosceles TaxID=591936 RepID=UPI000C2A9666|nr:uncharacterized protein LOC111542715 [Piliocolobus tephrosceles]